MPNSEAAVIGVELERVEKTLPMLFDKDETFFSTIDKRPAESVSGRDMRMPLKIRPGGKSGFYNPDGGSLGRGDSTTYDKALIGAVHMRHAVEMTQKQIWGTDEARKAVVDAFQDNLADAMTEFRRFCDSMCMTDGTGVMATVTSVSTSGGIDTLTLSTDGFRARLLRFGMNINIYNAAQTVCRTTGGPGNELAILKYDLANNQIQVTTGSGVIATDVIVASGIQSTPPVGLLGIKYHNSSASTGTWLSMDRAANPEIRANGVDASSAALTLPLARLAVNKIGDRLGINRNSKLTAWCHPAQQAAYEELAQLIIRIDKGSNDKDVDLYFGDSYKLAGAPLKKSFSWDRTRIDFIDPEMMGRAELTPPAFYKNPQSGKYVFEMRASDGGVATSWIFYIVSSFNLFARNPAGLAAITNLAVLPGY
jgi:hypothetical protein